MSTENIVLNLEYQRLRKEILAYIAENHREARLCAAHDVPGVTRFDIKKHLDTRCAMPACRSERECNISLIREVLIDLMQAGAIQQTGAVMHGDRLIPVFQLARAGDN